MEFRRLASCTWLLLAAAAILVVTQADAANPATSSVYVGKPCSSSTKPHMLRFAAPPPATVEHGQQPAYFAVCAAVKDQNADIREWVHYYNWLGAGAIYVYDHGSRQTMYWDLQDWIHAGVVHYTYFKFSNSPDHREFHNTAQGAVFQECIRRARDKHQWLALFDVDEFLVLAEGETQNITSLLKGYEQYGGLVVNWRIFSSSGHKTKPQNVSTLEAYTRCIPDNQDSHNSHVKSIVNVPHTEGVGHSPHAFQYMPGFYAVNELEQRRDGAQSTPVSVTRLALNHYCLKSKEEYLQKSKRGSADGGGKGAAFWNSVERLSNGTCLTAVAIGKKCCS
jgi:hypothetical protein